MIALREGNTVRSLLVAPKDKDNITQKSGVIYGYRWNRLKCEEEYTGQPAKTFWGKVKEHVRALSPIYDHVNTLGCHTKLENFSIVGRKYPIPLLGPSRRLCS